MKRSERGGQDCARKTEVGVFLILGPGTHHRCSTMVHSGLALHQVEFQAISKLESLPKIQEWVSKMNQWKRFQCMEKRGPARVLEEVPADWGS